MGIDVQERRCPVCGKEFVPTSQWVYRDRVAWFCSYGCKRQAELRKEKLLNGKRRMQRRLTPKEVDRVLSLIRKGVAIQEIMVDAGVTESAVRYYIKKMARAEG